MIRLRWAQASGLAPLLALAHWAGGPEDPDAAAVPRILASGVGPMILEYIDQLTMATIAQGGDLDLGVPASVQERTQAYLVVVQEERTAERLAADVEELAGLLADTGADGVYVLPGASARRLIEAREKAFWAARRAGADDIVDAVVPAAAMADFLAEVGVIATRHARLV